MAKLERVRSQQAWMPPGTLDRRPEPDPEGNRAERRRAKKLRITRRQSVDNPVDREKIET